jgi:hypothetical protein
VTDMRHAVRIGDGGRDVVALTVQIGCVRHNCEGLSLFKRRVVIQTG